MKHIKMPKEIAAKWLTALRSGEYAQANGKLQDGDKFCCLGVLQMCTRGKVEREIIKCEFPAKKWLRKNNITFLDMWGESSLDPFLADFGKMASVMNDTRYDFGKIADEIEKELEFID